jgi:hypothetical protein
VLNLAEHLLLSSTFANMNKNSSRWKLTKTVEIWVFRNPNFYS